MSERRSYTFSMDAPECRACPYYDDCKNKRMVACAYLEPALSPAASEAMQSMVEPVLAPRECREVYIDGAKLTLDLAGMKKKMQDDFYRALSCGFLGGAT